MKKIISGKVYNTETAAFCGSRNSGTLPTDFNFWEEILYKKKTNEFFLYTSGGPYTRYGIRTADGGGGFDEQITPLSFEAARNWAEENLDGDEFEETFGPVDEDEGGKKLISLYLPEGLVNRLSREATEAGKTFTAYAKEKLEA